jgi:F-type H+-transporting ATPase subunit b
VSRTYLAIASLVLSSSSALAGGGGGHHEPHVANVWGVGSEYSATPAIGLLAITFVIFVVVLAFGIPKLGVPGVVPLLTKYLGIRADAIEQAMAEAKKAKEDAERRAKDAEQKLAALEGEVARMQADFEAQGKLEAERIQKAAGEMANKIAKDAEDTIAAELQRAREQLRAEASALALKLAEERIQKLLTPADDQKLKKSLIAELSA